jgi:hypothetical protein
MQLRTFLTPFTAGSNEPSDVVDIFNVSAGTWTTAKLQQARSSVQATSLPNLGVAIFAGGYSKPSSVFFAAAVCV